MNDQEAKKEILAAIKQAKPESLPLPEIDLPEWSGDKRAEFINTLIGFDGAAALFKTREDALAWLHSPVGAASDPQIPVYSSAPGFEGNVTEEDIADLRNAHKIKACVTEGEIGVGEMGAIWVTDKSLKHAICALLAERMYVLLDSAKIVGGLQDAYERLNLREQQYGSFFAGPSATADIEAIHITGAQGPLGLTALIYNCEDAPEQPQVLDQHNKPA